VSVTTPVTLSLDGTDFNSELKSTLQFDNLSDEDGLTMRIFFVTASIQGTEIMRTFSVDQKLELMQFSTSTYYKDGHFCRYAETNTSDERVPFYISNPSQSGDVERFEVGNKGYDQCQSVDDRSSDSFLFLPNSWVFQNYDETSGEIIVQVTAVIDDCSTSTRRRAL